MMWGSSGEFTCAADDSDPTILQVITSKLSVTGWWMMSSICCFTVDKTVLVFSFPPSPQEWSGGTAAAANRGKSNLVNSDSVASDITIARKVSDSSTESAKQSQFWAAIRLQQYDHFGSVHESQTKKRKKTDDSYIKSCVVHNLFPLICMRPALTVAWQLGAIWRHASLLTYVVVQ